MLWGGINSIEQIEKLIALGVEKVSISSAAIKNPELISEAANRVGSQSIVITLDVKKTNPFGKYMVHTHNGKKIQEFLQLSLPKRWKRVVQVKL